MEQSSNRLYRPYMVLEPLLPSRSEGFNKEPRIRGVGTNYIVIYKILRAVIMVSIIIDIVTVPTAPRTDASKDPRWNITTSFKCDKTGEVLVLCV